MTKITTLIRVLMWIGACFSLPQMALAQFGIEDMAPVTQTYALTNATVVQAPGKTMTGATVILRDGLIVQVGSNVKIPGDAEVIAADSMFIYAGFISGLAQAGVMKPKGDNERRRPDNPGTPPNDMAGITPEKQVADMLNPQDNDLGKMREAGFTAAHVVPYGNMLPGSGAIILFKGKKPEDMLLKMDVSQFVQFEGSGRMFPSTVMGIMAKYRQLYKQAALSQQHDKIYATSPEGVQRPDYGNEIKAFYPVVDRQKPAYFKTTAMLEAYRAMQLQKELGFQLVLADVNSGWDLVQPIKELGAKVFLSLDLPEMMEGEREAAPDSVSADSVAQEPAVPTEAEKEMMALKQRKKEAIEQAYRQAEVFADAGIDFGFSTIAAKPNELLKNIKKMVKMGLPADKALSSLTTQAAEMLGVTKMMGTVENGKMANLIVSDSPIFEEESAIRYVFVEGEMFEYEGKSSKKSDPNAVVSIAGTWDYMVESPQGNSSGTIEILGGTGNYSGSISNNQMGNGPTTLDEIKLEGNQITFKYTFPAGGSSVKAIGSVVVEGNTFEGTVSVGEWGSFPIEGKLKGTPNRR